MKLLLCDDKTCIHNEDTRVNGANVLICAIYEEMTIDTYRNSCDKYEEAEEYFKRIE